MLLPSAVHRMRFGLLVVIAAANLGRLPRITAAAERPAIAGYADYNELVRQVAALAKPGWCEVSSLGTTLGGRKIFLISVTAGPTAAAERPAILIVGSVHAPQLMGSELAVRMARPLIDRAGKDTAVKELLDRFTFYIIPRPSPDASEAFFQLPLREREGNLRITRDSRDPDSKDPAEDLNGDGMITMTRVADDSGHWMVHPDDPRILIQANHEKAEHGQYELYTEGRHDDDIPLRKSSGDGWGEGVAFNHNFPFRYPYFKPGAGPNAVSEVESRAVADFAFDHPNIAIVFSFTPEDNLMHPWHPGGDQGRAKTSLQQDDAAEFDHVAEEYRTLHGGSDAPESPTGEGSFSEWAYFQYGRWSFAARGWWIPKVDPPADLPEEHQRATPGVVPPLPTPTKLAEKHKPLSGEKRGAEQLNALNWMARERIDGFVPWTPIQHPDFPGRKVEVGGFKPFVLLNPPAKELDPLAERHTDFVLQLARLMPRLKIREARAEPLGSGIQRITVTVENTGYLATSSAMGQLSGEVFPLLLRLDAPKGSQYLKGTPRTELERIRGGDKVRWTWLIRPPEGKPSHATVRVSAPAAGFATATFELK
jgi:hypothetical protein